MMKRLLTAAALLLSFSLLKAQDVNITFELNTLTIANDISPDGIFIAGGAEFGQPGDNPMVDPDGDGIYTITVTRAPGTSSFYTFTNGNCPGDFSCKENLVGLPCGDPDNFNDRFFPAVTQDTTIRACFGTCDDDGTCTIVSDSVNVTFVVGTADIEVDTAGIYIAGGGTFGVPGDFPLTDNGDSTWSYTGRFAVGFFSYYAFTNGACGDFSCKEDLNGLPCGDPGNFNDRSFTAPASDTTIYTCYATCDSACGAATSIRSIAQDQSLFELHPSLADAYTLLSFGDRAVSMTKQIEVLNINGSVIKRATSTQQATYRIETQELPAGLYIVNVRAEGKTFSRKFTVLR